MSRSILFVCVGNICRSPLAAAFVQHRLADRARVESAGIFGLSGHVAAPEAVRTARERGLRIAEHRARHVRELDLSSYDLVVALTPAIGQVLVEEYGLPPDKVVSLDVDDPYGAEAQTFRECMDEIERQIDEMQLLPSASS